ncbi:MAG: fibrobacter succinogenes major paralogous domain-containing protein [Bacteroidales bacterium]|nr:fibrobacter succinogenes major paralogous domain-containing protein [Bacteroidales bacterium]
MKKSIKHVVYPLALISMSLFVIVGCSDEDLAPDNQIDYGSVTDIEGNEYKTVVIGDQEWMAENLRVTRYNNGDAIPGGLNDTEWENTASGAYAVYPHTGISGLGSDEEVLGAYGVLYNWFAVDDERGLCPAGWRVPGDEDWTQLVDSLVKKYNLHNYWAISDIDGAGNALKSCRQANSPLGGSCNTSGHPRWNAHDTHYGMNLVGLSLLPGGNRIPSGQFFMLGTTGYWWSADEHSTIYAWAREASNDVGNISSYFPHKSSGLSICCVREFVPPEDD